MYNYTPTLFSNFISCGDNSVHFVQTNHYKPTYFFILPIPGSHYCCVHRDSVEWEVCLMLLCIPAVGAEPQTFCLVQWLLSIWLLATKSVNTCSTVTKCIILAATLCKKATIHQVTTMLATSKNVLFPGHNHLLTIGTDEIIARALVRMMI